MKVATARARLPVDWVGDHEFAVQTRAVQERVNLMIVAMHDALGESQSVREAVERLATRLGCSRGTAQRWWNRVLNQGWRGAIDARKLKAVDLDLQNRPVFVQFWKALCERHNRSCRAAWQDLCMLWRTGHEIEGYPECAGRPAAYGKTGLPRGWTYGNLMRFAPEDTELVIARQGGKAFRSMVTNFLTTRVGMQCGMAYQFDDVWHDHKTFFGKSLVRPLELGCIDVFSTRRVLFGLAPRIRNERDAAENLKERHMLWLVLALLTETGYSPEQCALIVEHRTAAIPEWFEQKLSDLSRGVIRVERSGIQDKPALLGWWSGEGGGNPRMKAALESLHGFYHNRLGLLPAQTGSNSRLDEPEESVAIQKYADQIARQLGHLPPDRCEAMLAQLNLPALTFHQFHKVLHDFYTVIDARREHALEGWERAGLVRAQFRLTEASQEWQDAEALIRMPDSQRAAVRAWIDSNAALMRSVKLSPLEVWGEGRSGLKRMPRFAIPQILGDKFAREITCRGHRIEFTDAEIDPDPIRYEGAVTDVSGHKMILNDGDSYRVYVNPLAPDVLYVCGAGDRYLGCATRILKAPRIDREAVLQAVGKDAARINMHMAGYRARHAGEADAHQQMLEHNRRVLAGERSAEAELESAGRMAAASGAAEDLVPAAIQEREDEDPSAGLESIF